MEENLATRILLLVISIAPLLNVSRYHKTIHKDLEDNGNKNSGIIFTVYTGHTQKNGAVSKVNKKFISHLTRAQRTPSAAATVQVPHALPAVRMVRLF